MDQKSESCRIQCAFLYCIREIVILPCNGEVVPISGQNKAPAVSGRIEIGRSDTLHPRVSEELADDSKPVELGFE